MNKLGTRMKNHIGIKYGLLTVLSLAKIDKIHHRTYWNCVCQCGNKTIIRCDCLKQNYGTKSCGCLIHRRGSEHPLWKGRLTTTQGYIKIKVASHPNAPKARYIMEHVLIMERKLKRFLRKNEQVHHKNGIRSDNRISNLELWTTSHPCGQRPKDLIKWALQILHTYKPKVLK